MIVLLSLAGILLTGFIAFLLIEREGRKHRAKMAQHAQREAIRQSQQLHPHERGDVPAEERVDRGLARRIARAKPGKLIQFKAGPG